MKATAAKQETLIYALGAAAVVIVILLGMVVYLMTARGESVNSATDIPAVPGVSDQQSAPPLSEDQINQSGGQLPSGHVPVGSVPGAPTAPQGGATGEAGK